MSTTTGAARDQARRLVRRVAVVAVIDAGLLAALLAASLTDRESWVDVLGPVHGLAFLLELFLAVRGAGERSWGWWFPVAVIVTGGPLGALIGHRVVTRRLATAPGP
jgi:Domain of unknown function (DUF3817)